MTTRKVLRKIEQAVLQGGLVRDGDVARKREDDDLRQRLHLGSARRSARVRLSSGSDEEHAMDRGGGLIGTAATRRSSSYNLQPTAIQPTVPSRSRPNSTPANCCWRTNRRSVIRSSRPRRPTLEPKGWPGEETLGVLIRKDGQALASGAIIKVTGITGRIRRISLIARMENLFGPATSCSTTRKQTSPPNRSPSASSATGTDLERLRLAPREQGGHRRRYGVVL